MKYCPNCGNPVYEDEKFCSNCGKNLSERRNPQHFGEEETQQKNEIAQERETVVDPEVVSVTRVKRKISKLGIVSFICSLTIILSPLAVLLAIIDLCRKSGKRKGFSIAALIIGGLIVCFAFFSGNNSSYSKEQNALTSGEREQYRRSCKEVRYEEVARDPDSYKGKKVKITGKVLQVSEGYRNSITLRVASAKDGYGDVWYVTYVRGDNEARILEDDIVVIYGECNGITTYKSVLGAKITIPAAKAKLIEISKE